MYVSVCVVKCYVVVYFVCEVLHVMARAVLAGSPCCYPRMESGGDPIPFPSLTPSNSHSPQVRLPGANDSGWGATPSLVSVAGGRKPYQCTSTQRQWTCGVTGWR